MEDKASKTMTILMIPGIFLLLALFSTPVMAVGEAFATDPTKSWRRRAADGANLDNPSGYIP
jgi:hypothetical protein